MFYCLDILHFNGKDHDNFTDESSTNCSIFNGPRTMGRTLNACRKFPTGIMLSDWFLVNICEEIEKLISYNPSWCCMTSEMLVVHLQILLVCMHFTICYLKWGLIRNSIIKIKKKKIDEVWMGIRSKRRISKIWISLLYE